MIIIGSCSLMWFDLWSKAVRYMEEEASPWELNVNQKDFEVRRGRYKELCDKGYLKCINTIGVSKEVVAENIRRKLPQ